MGSLRFDATPSGDVPNGELLTVQQVAERLKMNPETVRRWLRQGKLRGYLLGGDRSGYRVAADDPESFIRARGTRNQALPYAGWVCHGDELTPEKKAKLAMSQGRRVQGRQLEQVRQWAAWKVRHSRRSSRAESGRRSRRARLAGTDR